jgi:NadR type nicotinamide-nucleotide adenylyltransferase
MHITGHLRKIVVTGPESTGKSTLSETLATRLNAVLVPEYARSYVEQLGRPYTFRDVENIARYQVRQEKECSALSGNGIVVFDTWLILTKVWFDVVYGRVPGWIDEYIRSSDIALFLVCKPDLPWVADSVRENGGEMRDVLFNRYCREIEHYGFNYEIVEGKGDERWTNALRLIGNHHIT